METPELHSTAQFAIEDLLDFPNDEGTVSVEASITTGPGEFAAVLLDNSCNSPSSFPDFHAAGIVGPGDGQFASELCAPYDDVAGDLEWLSNIVDESFCSEDLRKLQLLQGIQARTSGPHDAHRCDFQPEPAGPISSEMPVPAKARSKRSRGAPENRTSRPLAVSAPAAAHKKKETPAENDGRRCLHCATDKTPQWRTGPRGPKTLCNACGVRYKSGRLVPEYRPASSPTFVLTKHSNSHRKVLELRRQKEVQQQFLHHNQSMMFDVSNGDAYLIHQHIGPDFRQLI